MTAQRRLPMAAPQAPIGVKVVSYGGGVNSVAVLVHLQRIGETPAAIVMADPGSERRATIAYRDEVLPAWLDRVGFPRVTVIDRVSEGRGRPRTWRLETLEEECLRIGSVPSIAYGSGKCSQKYKGDTQRWWLAKQPFAQAAFDRGEKVIKAIGYDVDERHRVRSAFPAAWEAKHCSPWYPLVDAGIDRDDCEELIRSEGLPVPPKSACTFCPNNTLEEWEDLRREEPEAFARAVAMSRNAESSITSPDVVGLMRCNEHGKRQLHVWADGGYGEVRSGREEDQPCECAL